MAATTIFIQPNDKNFEFPLPQANKTEHITRAVVKLSAIGERKNVIIPVKIKSCRKLNPLEVNYMGRIIKVAGTRPSFADWTVTVINDEDFAIRNDLEKWMNYMNGHVDNQQLTAMGDYKTDGTVTQLSKDGSKLREYKFRGIFPTSVASIALDWATEDIQEFETTFSVDWWEASGISYPKGDNGTGSI